MLHGLILVGLTGLANVPNAGAALPGASSFEGTWKVLAESVSIGRTQGISTSATGHEPTLIIQNGQLTLTSMGKKTVYQLAATADPAQFRLTPMDRLKKGAPITVVCTLDGDLLKVCRVADIGEEDNQSVSPPIAGLQLPPYYTVHPYWKNVLYLAKRVKP
jgi:uncharacterized protein (TIGR03067 family)